MRFPVGKYVGLCAIAALSFLLIVPENIFAQPGGPGGRRRGQRPQGNRAARASAAAQPKATPLPNEWSDQVKWRSIGPANMSGRITAIAVYEKDPCIWWAASASGGLLKTTNNGINFEHQFDDQATVSIGDVQVAQSDPNIVWVGTGESNPRNSVSWGDGVYKSTDGGETWKNMGLKKTFQTGAIAIHPEDPNIVYVGSLGRLWGDNPERGLYKTTDGGENWTKVLHVNDQTGVVDVQMNPNNPDELLIATYERQRDGFDGNDPGKRFGAGSGIYKTTDGGDSFQRISDGLPTCNMGRIGLDYYRADPNYVFAIVESEMIAKQPEDAPFAGLRGEDADVGARVTRVEDDGPANKAGLKDGDIVVSVNGRIIMSYNDMMAEIRRNRAGDKVKLVVSRDREQLDLEMELATIPSNGNGNGRSQRTPFTGTLGGQAANLQDQQGDQGHQYGGVYMSADGGSSWTRVNSLNPRPMYYSHIRVDPTDRNNVYVCGTSLYRSFDGGETFNGDGGSDGIHVDHHALWIDGRDSRHMILGNDGGIYVTYDRMEHWDHHNHIAIGQFYHVGVDTELNYRVYGGLQDNGSWGGPSQTMDGAGSVNADWIRVGGGDGFVTMADPNDKDQIYFESQNGGTGRINLRTGERGFIRPRPPRGTRYRFNWKTPFLLSPHNSQVYYNAGNYVFKSYNKGDAIKAISPEITNTDQGAGSALTESPVEAGVLYVGTTDGALWMTRNGGEDWLPLYYTPEVKKEESDDDNDDAQEGDEEITSEKGESESADAGDDPVTGTWVGKMISDRIPEDRAGFEFQLKLVDGKVTGTMENRRSGDTQEFEAKYDAESGMISWIIEGRGEREYNAKIENGTMKGDMVAGGGRFEMEFEATRKKDPATPLSINLDARGLSLITAVHGAVVSLRDDPISGTWKGVIENEEIPGGRIEYTVELKLNDKNQISGVIISPMGEVEITEGKFDQESKLISVHAENDEVLLDYDGKLSGGAITGDLDINQGAMQMDFSWEHVKKEVAQENMESLSDQPQDAAQASTETASKPEAQDAPAAAESKQEAETADDDPISGEWTGTMESNRGSQDITINLVRKNNDSISGVFESRMGENNLTDGKFNPETGKLTFRNDNDRFEMTFDGKVSDGKYVGSIDINGGAFSMDFSLERTSTKPAEGVAAAETDDEGDDATAKEPPRESISNLKDLMPGPRWVSSLEASRFNAGRCYVTFDGHRSNDDMPHLFVTEDYGKTWTSIKGNLPDTAGSVRVLREDVENQNLLYLGCEFSAWFSVDRGKSWTRFTGLPTVAVHEFAVHPKAGEVVAGTHGRSLWIADVTALRQWKADSPTTAVTLYKPRDVIRWSRSQARGDMGPREFHGENPDSNAQICFSLGQNARSISLEIMDLRGNVIRRFDDVSQSRGLHVVDWDLRQQAGGGGQGRGGGGQGRRGGGFRRGPTVSNGQYLVQLTVNGEKHQQVLSVKADPTAPADRIAEDEAMDLWWDLLHAGD